MAAMPAPNETTGFDEYADLQTQVLASNLQVSGAATGEVETVKQNAPVSKRGIDSDELAELVYMRRMSFLELQTAGSEPGTALYELDLGLNLSKGEFPTNVSQLSSAEIDDTIGDDPSDVLVVANEEEPGVIDSLSMTAHKSYKDNTNGNGGGGAAYVQERDLNFRHTFGTGPFVDRTDDLSLHQEINSRGSYTGNAFGNCVYFLYWNVEEQPEGRASFARP